jgi:acyl phosphate:glycerol-3-phosphate acyltransferase
MDSSLLLPFAVIGGYLLGSLPFAVITAKLFGLADPRTFGSGNPGATNVLRSGNKLAAVITLVGDAAKGTIAMAIAREVSAGDTAIVTIAAAGVAAFIGHVFPFTLGFKGGKGVATALGVMLGFSLTLAAWVALLWLGVAVATRYSSLAAIIAALAAPVIAWRLFDEPVITASLLVMSVILVLRHRSNIKGLLAGTESRIGSKKKA